MRKFEWCLERGKLGDKHRGLRKTEPNSAEADRHIGKALHNLEVMAMIHRICNEASGLAAGERLYSNP